MEIEFSINRLCTYWHKKGASVYWHREDGPARIYKDGREFWYYYDEHYDKPEDMPLNLFLAYCKWEYKKNGQV